jgi:hypothetical protein
MTDIKGLDLINGTGLVTKAVLANISIGVWSGRKFDSIATKAVAQQMEATDDWGNSNKALIDPQVILNFYRVAGRARRFHETFTLPWSDVGSRLLPTKAYNDYLDGINKHINMFWETIETFYAAYPALIEARRPALGNMFKMSDYPTAEGIKAKFHFTVSFAFLPDPNTDIRLSLNQIEIDKVRSNMVDTLKQVEQQSETELWSRMKKIVERIVDRLGDPEKVFQKVTFENIDKLEREVELLNITDNQEISDTMGRIRDDLTKYSPNEIRTDDEVRKVVHGKAKNILDKIQSFV